MTLFHNKKFNSVLKEQKKCRLKKRNVKLDDDSSHLLWEGDNYYEEKSITVQIWGVFAKAPNNKHEISVLLFLHFELKWPSSGLNSTPSAIKFSSQKLQVSPFDGVGNAEQ